MDCDGHYMDVYVGQHYIFKHTGKWIHVKTVKNCNICCVVCNTVPVFTSHLEKVTVVVVKGPPQSLSLVLNTHLSSFAFRTLSLVLITHLAISLLDASQSLPVPSSPAFNILRAHTSRCLVNSSVWLCIHTQKTKHCILLCAGITREPGIPRVLHGC